MLEEMTKQRTTKSSTARNSAWTKFIRASSGNVAMMFAVILLPLLGFAGVALDYSRAALTRTDLREAADAGLLAAVRAMNEDKELSIEEATEVARRYFDANYPNKGEIAIKGFVLAFNEATETYSLDVDGAVETTLLGIFGRPDLAIDIITEAKVAAPQILEVALVLDNTYSMTGSKIDSLKSATTELINIIMDDEAGDTSVAVSVVPFSQYVNVGIDRRNESWIDIEEDYSTTEYKCSITYPDLTAKNCVEETRTCYRDGIPYDCTYRTCEYDYGEPQEVCSDRTYKYTWYGCVGSRDYPMNITDGGYASLVPGLANYSCPNALLPLTTDKAAVESAIAAMYPQGETYIPSGLTWGQRVLSNEAPFTEAHSYEEVENGAGLKVLILMTDGANTKSPIYPKHYGSDAALSDSLTNELCENIKKNKVQIYTISFGVEDAGAKMLLESCASTPGHYFSAMDSAALLKAFESIGGNLHNLALTK